MKEFVRIHRLLFKYKGIADYDLDYTLLKDDKFEERQLDTIRMNFERICTVLSLMKDITIIDMCKDTISIIGRKEYGYCQCDITVRCY